MLSIKHGCRAEVAGSEPAFSRSSKTSTCPQHPQNRMKLARRRERGPRPSLRTYASAAEICAWCVALGIAREDAPGRNSVDGRV